MWLSFNINFTAIVERVVHILFTQHGCYLMKLLSRCHLACTRMSLGLAHSAQSTRTTGHSPLVSDRPWSELRAPIVARSSR